MTAVQSTTPGQATAARAQGPAPAASVPLTRLTLIELRKLADTRSGFWLLVVIGLAAAATAAIMLAAAPGEEQTFYGLLSFGMLPAAILLPVLGVLSMTSEWSQRTALTTFTLVPGRGRVIAAKLLAGVAIAVLATLAAAALSAVANLIAIGTGGDGSWDITADQAGRLLLNQVVFLLMGSAFGALLMNTPLAIVLFFALPSVWSILAEMVKPIASAARWADITVTSVPLSEAGAMSGGEWARFAVATGIWVVVPLVLGTLRTLRREVS